jgi:hypothetical protein
VDKITIEESPAGVTVNPIDQVTVSSMRVTWTEATIENFKEYRVYRSESSTVNETSTLMAILTNKSQLSFADTGLTARKTYYYRVYLYDTTDTGVGSNQSSAMTRGVPVGWTDSFETNQSCWTFTGIWSRQINAGRDGSYALVDSAGDYSNSSDTYAQVAVDLAGTTWPVLKFWDHHAFADSDWGRLWISVDAGGSWTPLYGVTGVRTNWVEQSIDLSPWKNQSQVWLRFQVGTDGGTQNDGWYIDDVVIGENTPNPASYPFFESFENALTNWLSAGWTTSTSYSYAGATSGRNTTGPRMTPETVQWLVLNQALSLSNAASPQLTFWVRGKLDNYSQFRAQVSADGGLNWSELSAVNLDNGFNSDWVRKQASLQSYTNRTIRLRFQINSYWGSAPYTDILLDKL